VLRYPMTPYAGVFIATVGVCVIAGALMPNHRSHLVWIGFALGAMLFVAFGQILSNGLHTPSLFQVSFLALAIVLEIAAFRYLMPIMRPRGERAVPRWRGPEFDRPFDRNTFSALATIW
jgi:drug/metabolite transporter (DMT)-like permease